MEDRATLRISSQHLQIGFIITYALNLRFRNYEKNGKIVDIKTEMTRAMKRCLQFENHTFKTACDLVFKGKDQPPHTEPLLHASRYLKKLNLGSFLKAENSVPYLNFYLSPTEDLDI